MKFKDLLLKEKDLADLEMDLRMLKDRRKNFESKRDSKGNLENPAEDGERAARLDAAIDRLEERIKRVKNVSPNTKIKKEYDRKLKESNLMEIDDSDEYWEYQRKKRALDAELKNLRGRAQTLLNKILKHQSDVREQKKKNPRFIDSNSSTLESWKKEHDNMESAIIKLIKQRNKITEDYQNKKK